MNCVFIITGIISKKDVMKKRSDPHYQAMSILSRRDHSVFEVKQKMKKKGFTTSTIEETIIWLKEKKFLNDRKFTEAYIRETLRFKLVGPRWIEAKLREKRVPLSFVEEVLSKKLNQTQEKKVLKQAIKSWQRSHSKYKDDKQRLTRFLFSRGFSTSVVIEVLQNE